MPQDIFYTLDNLRIAYFSANKKIHSGAIEDVVPNDQGSYLEYNFNEPQKLINAIAYDSILYIGVGNQRYEFIYRGQSNSTWNLVPSAYRNDIYDNYHTKEGEEDLRCIEIWDQIADDEKAVFVKFIKEIDKVGIKLEDDVFRFAIEEGRGFHYHSHPLEIKRHIWLKKEYLETLALAQHYGIPTRLLDFTKNPYTALFFAAVSCLYDNDYKDIVTLNRLIGKNKNEVKKTSDSFNIMYKETTEHQKANILCEKGLLKVTNDTYEITEKGQHLIDKKIGIWLIPEVLIYAANMLGRVNYIEIPKNQNDNMRAQHGVFINYIQPEFPYNIKYIMHCLEMRQIPALIMPPNSDEIEIFGLRRFLDEKNHLLGLDKILQMELQDEITGTISNSEKTKIRPYNPYREILDFAGKPRLFTLPWIYVEELIKRLDLLNINWTSIMPSIEGARHQAFIDFI